MSSNVTVASALPSPPSSVPANGSKNTSNTTDHWTNLLSLIKPSFTPITTSKNHTVLVNPSNSTSSTARIVAIPAASTFASHLLDISEYTTAIVTHDRGAGLLDPADLVLALEKAGLEVGNGGVVVVRESSSAQDDIQVEVLQPGLVELVAPPGGLFNHAVRLLATATPGTSANGHEMGELARNLARSVRVVRARFITEKVDQDRPEVEIDGEVRRYDTAGKAWEDMVGKVVRQQEAEKKEDVVYSVHLSDVNGLSRLDDVTAVGEITRVLDSMNVEHALSHSTISDQDNPAHGFALSICPIPTHFLEAQSNPLSPGSILASSTSSKY